jgi:hypothetical protein
MSSSFGPALAKIQSLMGTKYSWGGNDEKGIDCSGFTRAVFQTMGIELPRVSFQQAAAGQAVSRDQARIGDLVWWDLNGRNPGADHVGVYMGNGKVAEASSGRGQVVVRNLWGNAQFTRVGNVEDGGHQPMPELGTVAPGYESVGIDADQSAQRILAPQEQPEQEEGQGSQEIDVAKLRPEARGIT